MLASQHEGQNIKYLPHAFTEHGAIQAANVLNSDRAVEMGVYVVRAFVNLRGMLTANKELSRRLDALESRIEKKLTTHDQAIAAMLSAIRQLLDQPIAPDSFDRETFVATASAPTAASRLPTDYP